MPAASPEVTHADSAACAAANAYSTCTLAAAGSTRLSLPRPSAQLRRKATFTFESSAANAFAGFVGQPVRTDDVPWIHKRPITTSGRTTRAQIWHTSWLTDSERDY